MYIRLGSTINRLAVASLLISLGLALLGPLEGVVGQEGFLAGQQVISTTADFADAVFAADLDGDGDLDTLSASEGDDKIAWYENINGDGSAWTEHIISTTANGAHSVYAGDLDGDGHLDVLSASFLDDKIAWYENTNGDGSAWTAHTISTAANGAWSTYAADMDSDGDLDVLSASYFDDKIAWYKNINGTGSFGSQQIISSNADYATSVYAADVDGDGDLDTLSASAGDDKIAWYENTNGDGSAWTAQTLSTTADGAQSIYAADLDGDGDFDILSASRLDDKIAWYDNTNGDGSTWIERVISTTANGAQSVYTSDMDGDGDLDALSASWLDDKIAWYENASTNGDGSTWTPHTITTAANGAQSVYAADLDGDGDPDAMSASQNDDKIAWYPNGRIHCSVCFAEGAVISTGADGAEAVYSADLDGDGDLDVLSASSRDNKIAWYENASESGDGSIWIANLISTAADGASLVYAADLDGDGDMDVLSASSNDNKINWYKNISGDGSTWTPNTISTAPGAQSVFAADLNGDGDLDALSASYNDDKITWYENTLGDGSTWSSYTISSAADGAEAVFAADLDGDGDLDALSASEKDDTIAWYENTNGDGSAWTEWVISTTADGAQSVYAADLDRDGDLDALSASYNDDKIAWYENTNGDGLAWTEQTIATTADGAQSVYAADLDGDGDLDALSASNRDDKIAWYENTNGDGSVWTEQTISTTAAEAQSVYTADLDGDGDLDAMSASYFDDKIAWYPNNGGQIALATTDTAAATLVSGQVDDLLKINTSHQGRPGDYDAELVSLELLFEESAGDPLSDAEANAIIEALHIYLDSNGSGDFEAANDTLVTSVGALTLSGGRQTVSFTDGDPNVQVAYGVSRDYFVVLEVTTTAPSQTPHQLRLTHLAQESTAEDSEHDTPLRLACTQDISTGVVIIGPADTTTTLATSAHPSVFGQQVIFTATVSAEPPGGGPPEGAVTFKDGAATLGAIPLSSGIATLPTADLTVGTHTITAEYSGNTNFNGSMGALSPDQVVNKADTTTTLVSSSNPSVFGQSVTFTATVSVDPPGTGTPGGMVTFKDGAVLLGTVPLSGVIATFSTADLAAGTHTITAEYNGDSNFNSSIGTLLPDQVVDKANTTTSLVSWPNPSAFGQMVTLTATVNTDPPGAGTPGGTVTFKDGAATLGTAPVIGGFATHSTTNLAVGTHTISSEYSGDGNFNPSSDAMSHRVRVPDLAIYKRVVQDQAAPGQPLTYTLTFSNTGDILAHGVLITDVVPIHLSSISYQSTVALTETGTTSYTWQLGDLVPGAGGAITLTGVLANGLSAGYTFTNTATITASLEITLPNNNSSASVTVLNAPPVLGLIGNQSVDEEATLSFTANAFDPNQDVLSFSLDTGAPSGASIDATTGQFSWTPTEAQGPGIYHLTVRVKDSGVPQMEDYETFTITVDEVNISPVVSAGPDQSADEGEPVSFSGSFNDPGRGASLDTIHWDFGDGSTITGTLTPTHTYQDNGTYTVTLSVTDAGGAFGSDTLLISVKNVAPILASLPDQSIKVGESATATGAFTDPGSLDTHTVIIMWTSSISDTLDLEAGVGEFSASYTYMQAGEYTVTVTVTDKDGGATQGAFTVDVVLDEKKIYLPIVMVE